MAIALLLVFLTADIMIPIIKYIKFLHYKKLLKPMYTVCFITILVFKYQVIASHQDQ